MNQANALTIEAVTRPSDLTRVMTASFGRLGSQDADVAGSSFAALVALGLSANSAGGFGSATAPIREPFLN